MAHHETTDNEAEFHEEEAQQPAVAPPGPPPVAHPPTAPYPLPPTPRESSPQARMPFLAGLFSLFPGLGNIYNGLYMRGITFFLICIGLVGLASESRAPEQVLLVFSVIFVWFFNIFDAYRQATLINYGYTPDAEMPTSPRISAWGSGGLVAGVMVFAIGFYGFLREFFEIDLALLADYWYLLFMAFGGFMIARTVLDRKKTEAESDETLDDLGDI